MRRTYLWVEKYRPKRLIDVVNQEEAKKKLLEWIREWIKGKIPEKKAILLAGPPGTGKTTLAYALASEVGYEVLELNASDVRTSMRINQVLGRAMMEASLFGFKGRIILLDEVDGISVREDKGGLTAILNLIKEAKWPIIMTANNPWDPRFRQLRDEAEVIQIKPLSEEHIIQVLRRICNAEGIKCEEEALRLIAKASGGDLRAAINDLQAIAQGKKILTKDDVSTLSDRAHQYDMFKIIDKAFRIRRVDEVRSIQFLPSFDWEAFFPWALENVVNVYEKSPQALADAFDNLSLADVVRGRIMRRQEWELMPYMIEIMISGIALVKEKPPLPRFIRYNFPQKILILAKSKEIRQLKETIVNRLKIELHVSSREVKLEYIPLIKHLVKDKKIKERLIKNLVRLLGHSLSNVERALGIKLSE
ncbi:MAG: replication protein C [Thermoprotei archaeon ex4572_64]|nr:MAG: replication protein C [Thermoprotei archaeon ex4572_64]